MASCLFVVDCLPVSVWCMLLVMHCVCYYVFRLMLDIRCAYLCDVVCRLFFKVLLFGVCCWWFVVRCSVFVVNCRRLRVASSLLVSCWLVDVSWLLSAFRWLCIA